MWRRKLISEYGTEFAAGLIKQSKLSLFLLHRLVNIITALKPVRGERVLEIGCGVGTVSAEISKYGCLVTGIDFSETMINIAKTMFGKCARFSVGDAKDLSGHSGYDAIVAADVMEHLTDSEFNIVAYQCRSALNKNGRLIIYSPCRDHIIEVMKRNNFILKENTTHIGMRSENTYRSILGKYFSNVDITYSGTHIPMFNIFEKLAGTLLPCFRRRIIIVAGGIND
jgi:2-polyprenyl-3-methyl-5-hydroxy-6-metoxy-1,4-benzoquinol methylase